MSTLVLSVFPRVSTFPSGLNAQGGCACAHLSCQATEKKKPRLTKRNKVLEMSRLFLRRGIVPRSVLQLLVYIKCAPSHGQLRRSTWSNSKGSLTVRRLDGVVARITLPRAVSRVRRFREVLGLYRRGREVDVALNLLPGVRLGEDGRADSGFDVTSGHCVNIGERYGQKILESYVLL